MSADNNVEIRDQESIKTGIPGAPNKLEAEESRTAKEYKRSKDSDKLVMSVKVSSPFRDYYDGQAFSLSAENLTGAFDVLPKHHQFISLLSPCDLTIRTPNDEAKGPIRIRITGGLIHVKADAVIVFLDV